MKKVQPEELFRDFLNVLGVDWEMPPTFIPEIEKLISHCGDEKVKTKIERRAELISTINEKFLFNKSEVKLFLANAAKQKIYFNFRQKKKINHFFNSSDFENIKSWLTELKGHEPAQQLLRFFNPIKPDKTIEKIDLELDREDKKDLILSSLFSSYVFNSFSTKKVHQYFEESKTSNSSYIPNFFDYLQTQYGRKLSRELALVYINIEVDSFQNIQSLKNSIFELIRKSYNELTNHCYLAIKINHTSPKSLKWEFFSDLVLYAEKFKLEHLKKGYFHPKKIEEKTEKYISGINLNESKFHLANTGFTYKDCIILLQNEISNKTSHLVDSYNLLLLFEKNQRDEEIIPCPACRSSNVRGNSYPILGVKSWECNNLICPEKSKYNRGKRYSLSSLIRQESIENPKNEIDKKTINKWRLDVVNPLTDEEVISYLIKCYTLEKDNIKIYLDNFTITESHGRNISYKSIDYSKSNELNNFFDSNPYFKRFLIKNKNKSTTNTVEDLSNFNRIKIHHGDSYKIMSTFPKNSLDGAVTSPPYYNAKKYSQWPNIYCYLYDMYNNAREIFRILKPGANYIYNIFDYFDNENNIVFSAMGKKRMILGAYIIYIFNQIGFELIGNTIWFKGHIQGNRSFNNGNMSPYYQAPLNCYEHIFQFKKPGKTDNAINLPDILNAMPVIKMIKGKNKLGHTAPYPKDIPDLLTKKIAPNSTIIDPYSGSFTTAISAYMNSVNSINIEKNREYCELGIKLINKETNGKNLLFEF